MYLKIREKCVLLGDKNTVKMYNYISILRSLFYNYFEKGFFHNGDYHIEKDVLVDQMYVNK